MARPDHGLTNHFENEILFFQAFLLKNHLLGVYHSGFNLADLVRDCLLKVTMEMVWRVSSDKWKEPADSDTITDFFLSVVSFF